VTRSKTIAATSKSVFLARKITASTTYYVQVVPVDEFGEGTGSAIASVTCNPRDIHGVLNTVGFYLDETGDGKAECGEGYVRFDTDGVTIIMDASADTVSARNSLTFWDDENSIASAVLYTTRRVTGGYNLKLLSGLSSDAVGGARSIWIQANSTGTDLAQITIGVRQATGSWTDIVLLASTNTISMSGEISIAGATRPTTDNTYDLGTTSKRWKDAFLSGVIDLLNESAPSVSTDICKIWAQDQAAGNSCPHILTENGSTIKLFQVILNWY